MERQSKGNFGIDGIGSIDGGRFDQLIINGVGTLKHDVEADEIKVNGVGTFQGETSCQRLSVDGTASFKSHVNTNYLDINGNAKIKGNLQMETLDVDGNLTVEGHVKGEIVENEGRIVLNGFCEVEAFRSQGQVKILESLNAETIEIAIALKCEIKEMGGSQIKVTRIDSAPKFIDNLFPTILYSDLIEGDIIELAYTSADTVRGHDITIGESCHINVLEYSGTLNQHPTAIIKEVRHHE